MTQYCIKTNKVIQIIKYPDNINPCRQYCVKYKEKIYIIDGEHAQIILFDPITKEFTIKTVIPKLGSYPTAVVIFDKIHIIQGFSNADHLIYDITKNTVKILEDEVSKYNTGMVSMLLYKDKIFRFGGSQGSQRIDTFMISSSIKQNEDENIKWTEKVEFKLKNGRNKCAFVLYKNYLISFGGNPSWGKFVESICLLDLDDDVGWIELVHVKCPIASRYLAVLTPDLYVHLLTEFNVWPQWRESERAHYSIPISTILGSKFSK